MPAQKSAKPLKSAPGTAAKAATKTAAKAPAKAASQKAAAAPAPVAKKVKTVPVKSSAELTKAADELLKKKPARAKAAASDDEETPKKRPGRPAKAAGAAEAKAPAKRGRKPKAAAAGDEGGDDTDLSDIEADLEEPDQGLNVILHEIAHKLDALDGALLVAVEHGECRRQLAGLELVIQPQLPGLEGLDVGGQQVDTLVVHVAEIALPDFSREAVIEQCAVVVLDAQLARHDAGHPAVVIAGLQYRRCLGKGQGRSHDKGGQQRSGKQAGNRQNGVERLHDRLTEHGAGD